jgi:hypothetical protein
VAGGEPRIFHLLLYFLLPRGEMTFLYAELLSGMKSLWTLLEVAFSGDGRVSVHAPYLEQLEFYFVRDRGQKDKGVVAKFPDLFNCHCLGFGQVF